MKSNSAVVVIRNTKLWGENIKLLDCQKAKSLRNPSVGENLEKQCTYLKYWHK